jgi:hypothetical protein
VAYSAVSNLIHRTVYGAFLSSLMVAVPLCAATLYSDLGPGDSWNGFSAYDAGAFLGTTFTVTNSGFLENILLPVESNADFANIDSVGLYADSAGEPGTLLESWAALLPAEGNVPPLTDLTSVENPLLTAGTQYWLVIDAPLAGVMWDLNDQGVDGGAWSGTSLDGLSQIFSADATPAIDVTSMPEPSSAVFCGLAFLGLIVFRLRRGAKRSAPRVFTQVAARDLTD